MPGINRYGNNKSVLKTRAKHRLLFPALSLGSSGRILTKHFTNILAWLDNDSIALLGFLVYQSNTNNTIKYTTKLLEQYEKYVELMAQYERKKLKISVPNTREIFKRLITLGILLPTSDEKMFLVNPNLTYSPHAVRIKFYESWTMLDRNKHDIIELTTMYINHVKK